GALGEKHCPPCKGGQPRSGRGVAHKTCRSRLDLERESGDDLALSRRRSRWRDGCIDKSETGSRFSTARGLRGLRIRRWRVRQPRTIKDVRELGPDVEPHSPLADLETASESEVLLRLALIPIVAVIRRARAELARSWISPGVRVQHELFVGIEAVTVQILR